MQLRCYQLNNKRLNKLLRIIAPLLLCEKKNARKEAEAQCFVK